MGLLYFMDPLIPNDNLCKSITAINLEGSSPIELREIITSLLSSDDPQIEQTYRHESDPTGQMYTCKTARYSCQSSYDTCSSCH